MSPAVVDSVFLAAPTCIAGGIKARRIFFTLRHWQLTQQTEMVNRIISHAQHILSSPAILLFLPPVALFTKKLCFVYFEWAQKRPFLPEAKRNEKKSFFFRGAEGYEKHLVFYFWTDFHIHGHLREVRLLRPTSSHGEGQSVTGTQTQASILPNTHANSLSSLAPPRLSQRRGKELPT